MRAGWVTFVSMHILWACGWLGLFGALAPFASAQDLQTVIREFRESRLEVIQQQILSTRFQQCRTALDSAPRAQYTSRLDELYTQYKHLSGDKEPRVPNCDQT